MEATSMKTVMKVLAALAAIAGAIYVIATYGEQIVAWCKKVMAMLPKCDCECECEDCDCEEPCDDCKCACEAAPEEAPAEEAAPEEPAEEVPVVEIAADEVVANEEDFEG